MPSSESGVPSPASHVDKLGNQLSDCSRTESTLGSLRGQSDSLFHQISNPLAGFECSRVSTSNRHDLTTAAPGEMKRFAVVSHDGRVAGFADALLFPR